MKDFVGKPTKINNITKEEPRNIVSKDVLTRARAQRRVFKLLRLVESPEDPGCESCVDACCSRFIVHLTKDEFDSGLYSPYAIEIKQEDVLNISGIPATSAVMLAGSAADTNGSMYVLEGSPGTYCPFHSLERGCTIYDKRPYTCKAYTCAGDTRITEDMKKGLQ